MSIGLTNHAIYLICCAVCTVIVGNSLFLHGRVFLLECFDQNPSLADNVNRLLLTGFYLLNGGLVCLALRYGRTGTNLESSLEFLSTRLGANMLVLGYMHFQNILVLSLIRHQRIVSQNGTSEH